MIVVDIILSRDGSAVETITCFSYVVSFTEHTFPVFSFDCSESTISHRAVDQVVFLTGSLCISIVSPLRCSSLPGSAVKTSTCSSYIVSFTEHTFPVFSFDCSESIISHRAADQVVLLTSSLYVSIASPLRCSSSSPCRHVQNV